MTATFFDLALYAGGIFILFLTPGPVWMALVARTLSGGFGSAWPLALGVVIGDILWPIIAILGLSWVAMQYDGLLDLLKYVATLIFFVLGFSLISNPDRAVNNDNRLTRPGQLAGFIAGVAIILSNPKAILFYIGVLPGFFDLSRVTLLDIVAICTISAVLPFLGNLTLSIMVDRVRHLLSSPATLRKVNTISGILLILVGVIIPLT
ncbi:MAG: LysE family translocator [Paracoccaceae bacterium]|mgnify:FL=1|jgi:threonine/homoserine/homoserine lactone efflux protein|tara:strand:+ start:1679 stop:2299 length:621 start_codon:yes stop_codon:yes gene_type:complete